MFRCDLTAWCFAFLSATLLAAIWMSVVHLPENESVVILAQPPVVRDPDPNSEFSFDFSQLVSIVEDYGKYTDAERSKPVDKRDCTMATCFNFTNCRNRQFGLYLYPNLGPVNPFYNTIRSVLKSSGYSTEDPDLACVFVLGIDTLNRDILSPLYIKDIPSLMSKDELVLRYWNHGRNHLIFNMYSGSYPHYQENDLGFDFGYAILVKTSASSATFRPKFDISLPLFHDTLPARSEDALFPGIVASKKYPAMARKYLISFKGKRYLYGIGSDTRNNLYHIDNNRDVLILTTCNHGGEASKKLRDERCDQDDFRYNQNDYEDLLNNTTFCLVPRGRRLGSFRFLEVLKAGCIPVVLSNGWELPFSEIIDWSRAAVIGDERLLTQIPSMIRDIDFDRVVAMRQQCLLLYRQYFSSIERIVRTTLEIIRDRLAVVRRSREIWNDWPALAMTHIPNLELRDFHGGFLQNVHTSRPYHEQKFTLIINLTVKTSFASSVVKVLKELNRSPENVDKVLIFSPWRNGTLATLNRWKFDRLKIIVLDTPAALTDFAGLVRKHVESEAVIDISDDCIFSSDEFEFGFEVWKSFPERIAGYRSALHLWNEKQSAWKYSTPPTNDYSMVLLTDSFIHVQYYWLLLHYRTIVLPKLNEECQDILLNFIVAGITRSPPVRLTTRPLPQNRVVAENMTVKSQCLNELVATFGNMALVKSSVVYNPVLYKDAVSRHRKKYLKLED